RGRCGYRGAFYHIHKTSHAKGQTLGDEGAQSHRPGLYDWRRGCRTCSRASRARRSRDRNGKERFVRNRIIAAVLGTLLLTAPVFAAKPVQPAQVQLAANAFPAPVPQYLASII